jgi:hypothetical protein
MRLACATSSFVACVLASAAAVADPPPEAAATSSAAEPATPPGDLVTRRRAPEPPASTWDVVGLRGFEIQALGGIAYGGGTSPVDAPSVYGTAFQTVNPAGTILSPAGASLAHQAFTPYAYDPFGFSFAVGYRPLPALSFGAFYSYANYGNNADSTGTFVDQTAALERVRSSGGVYARYYFTQWSSRLQPWLQVGLGYVDDSASYSHPLGFGLSNGSGPDNGNYLVNYHGLTIPLGIGLDWRLAPVFAVGPFFAYEQAIPLGGCVQIIVDQAVGSVGSVNSCDGGVVKTHAYGSLLAGIFAKITFDPFAHPSLGKRGK